MSGSGEPLFNVEEMSEQDKVLRDAISAHWVAEHPDADAGEVEVDTPPPGGDEDLPGEPGVEEVSPDAESTPETPPAEPTDEPVTFTLGERTFDQDEAERLLGLYEWATSMDEATAQQITNVLSGEYELVPRGGAPRAAEVPAPTPEPQPDLLGGIDPDLVDPGVLQVLRAQQESMAALQARLDATAAQSEQALQAQARAEFQAAASKVTASVSEKYGFDEDTMGALARASAQYVDRFAPGYNDPEALFDAVLEHTLWTTPRFRDAALNNVANARAAEVVEKQAVTSAQIAEKAARSQGAATTSGSIPRSNPTPRNMSRAERAAAMTAELAEALSGP